MDTLCCACTAGWTTPTPLTSSFHCFPEVGLAYQDGSCCVAGAAHLILSPFQITIMWQWIFLAMVGHPTDLQAPLTIFWIT